MTRLLTVVEVGELLQIPPEKVLVFIRNHQLAAVRLSPQTIRVEPAAIENFIQKKRTIKNNANNRQNKRRTENRLAVIR